MTKLEAAQNMLTWLAQEGGYVHPSVEVRDGKLGGMTNPCHSSLRPLLRVL